MYKRQTLRTQTRADIVTLQDRLGTTTLYVTHDQVEAMTMGDRIAVMSAGALQQVAAPQEIYETPANTFVAGSVSYTHLDVYKRQAVSSPKASATQPCAISWRMIDGMRTQNKTTSVSLMRCPCKSRSTTPIPIPIHSHRRGVTGRRGRVGRGPFGGRAPGVVPGG